MEDFFVKGFDSRFTRRVSSFVGLENELPMASQAPPAENEIKFSPHSQRENMRSMGVE